MGISITLSEYVKRRNGVNLGAQGSMKNMLERSFGASSFSLFWRYWNPVWGYYLSKKVMKPLGKFLPLWLAIIITFSVSGALHDLAVTLVKMRVTLFFTPWFFLMSLFVVATNKLQISYGDFPWYLCALINLSFIVFCLFITYRIEHYYA